MSDDERKPSVVDERENDCRELIHVHSYQTLTLVADGHNHLITGVSAPARLANGTHVHRVRGRTTFVDGHWHAYDVITGPEEDMGVDTHVHYFAGVTSEADDHVHEFQGVTSLAPDFDELLKKYPKRD